MPNKCNLLLALGVSCITVLTVLHLCANRWQRDSNRAQRKALQRWENEGGNVRSAVTQEPAASTDTLSQNAVP
jgi:hypothetical protein